MVPNNLGWPPSDPHRGSPVSTREGVQPSATARMLADSCAGAAVREALANGPSLPAGELLVVADGPDTAILRERLADADPAADVVLTPEEESAYQRAATAFTAVWERGDGLHRFLY